MIKAPLKSVSDRPKQQVTTEVVTDLMGAVRNSFYADSPQWFKDQAFIRRNVVMWPAGWLNRRGVTLRPERYKSLLIEIFNGVKQCGKTEAVKYWPGYLMTCVQSHFRIHAEEIYNEGKSFRNLVENALLAGRHAKDASTGVDPVGAIALAHQALQAAHKRKQKPCANKEQLTFL